MHRLALCALALAVAACSSPVPDSDASGRVLVFSKTAGFRHASIEPGIAALRELGAARGFTVEATEDSTRFSEAGLDGVDAVVFLNTTGDVLGPAGQVAFEAYIEAGGGYVGVHAAADTEYDWPWYGRLVGAYFESHPQIQEATIEITDASHPATRDLPSPWVRSDEWYTYRAQPVAEATVLMHLDESSYEGGGMDGVHPIAWHRTVGEGRAVYTGLGHTDASYTEPAFRSHVGGAICWAARLACAR